MKPGAIRLQAAAELPVRVKSAFANEKCILIVFWEIQGIAHYCWLPKVSTLDSLFFRDEVPSPCPQKMQPNSKTTGKPLTLIHMDNARIHTARATQEKLDLSRFKRTPQPQHSPDIVPSSFSLFSWLNTQLDRREYNGEYELYEVVDEILTGLSIEMIEWPLLTE
jgi:hypothetical protein